MKKTISTLVAIASLWPLSGMANTSNIGTYDELVKKGGFPKATILGYQIKGCHSLGSGRNLCNTKDIKTILEEAKKTPVNFAKDKKLIQYKYHTTIYQAHGDSQKSITDVIVVDEKKKEIYVSDMFAYQVEDGGKSPQVYTKKTSSWYCVKKDGEHFNLYETPDYFYEGPGTFAREGAFESSFDPSENSWACNGFKNGKFYPYDNAIAAKESSFAWLDRHGFKGEFPRANY